MKKWGMMSKIHYVHPNGSPHPFKFESLCGSGMLRFGSLAMEGQREVTCKRCIKVKAELCLSCKGDGHKPDTNKSDKIPCDDCAGSGLK